MPTRFLAVLVAISFFGGCAPFPDVYPDDTYVAVEVGPPPPRVEVRPAIPFAGAVWYDGYYTYEGSRWEWIPGRWATPGWGPRPQYHFYRGRYYVPRGYVAPPARPVAVPAPRYVAPPPRTRYVPPPPRSHYVPPPARH